jgi:hypothetical protein
MNWNLIAYAPYNNFSFNPNTETQEDYEKAYGFYTST